MASTAYGGSSELVDILVARSGALRKHTFDVFGEVAMVASIEASLRMLEESSEASSEAGDGGGPPATVLFVEVPTNPDMKVPDLGHVTAM